MNLSKKISLFLFVTFFAVSSSFSQIRLQSTNHSDVKVSSNDLHNCVITSNYDRSLNVYLEITINSNRGFPVLIGNTENFNLNSGVNQISSATVNIKDKKYFNRDYGSYEQQNGYLPSDNYSVCITLKCADRDCLLNSIIGEQGPKMNITSCNEVAQIIATPLLLVSPFDEAELTEKRPNFSWIAPMPIGSDPNLTYKFSLVELREKQSGESGIRRNRPIYQVSGLKSLLLPFPPELEDLNVDTKYAWQVEAILGKTPIQKSEVWEFTIIEEETKVQPMPFVRLKKKDSDLYRTLNELKFIYDERNRASQLNFNIISANGEPIDVSSLQLLTKRGENKYTIDLTQFNMEHKESYTLIVRDQNGFSYRLKFIYYFGV